MTARPPWTPAEDTTLRALHESGRSLHSIAAEMSRSKDTISRKASALGLTWDRSRTAAAANAVVVDNKARRALLVGTLYTRAEELLAQITEPHLVFNFGGKENDYNERLLDRPPTGDIRNLMQSASIALQRAVDLENVDATSNNELPAVDAWIAAMTGGG